MARLSGKPIKKQVPQRESLSIGWMVAILVVVGAVVYLPSLQNDFIFDDRALVANNPLLRGAGSVKEVVTSGRTLRMISFVIDHALWGMNPVGYHITNVLLHILTGFLAFVLFRRLSGKPVVGFVAALVFLCHPLATESVASIANRKESLHSLFSLLAIVLYLKAEEKRWLYLLSLVSLVLALISKEVAIAVPVLMLVIDWLFRERHLGVILKRRGWFYGLLLVPIVAGAVYRFRGVDLGDLLTLDFSGGMPFSSVVATTLSRVVDYVRLTVVPYPLSADYYTTLGTFLTIKTLLGLVMILGIVLGGYMVRRRQPLVALGLFWVFITWLPVSNLFPSAYFLAERYFYFPLLGVTLLAAVGWEAWRRQMGLSAVGLGVVVVVFGALTFDRCDDWRDEYTLWRSTLRHQPENPKAHYYFANGLRERGQYREAVNHFRRAVELKPDFIWAWVNMANIYTLGQDYRSAIPTFQRVLELDPNLAVAHNNLGCAYYNMGEVDSARAHYATALKLNSSYGEAWNNVGVALYESGHLDSAVTFFYHAIKNSPTWHEPYQRMIQCLIELGEFQHAKTALDRYLALPYIPDREARQEQRGKIISILESQESTESSGISSGGSP
jgi:tetratricopeptide (TPR) repeat protein